MKTWICFSSLELVNKTVCVSTFMFDQNNVHVLCAMGFDKVRSLTKYIQTNLL